MIKWLKQQHLIHTWGEWRFYGVLVGQYTKNSKANVYRRFCNQCNSFQLKKAYYK